MLIETPEIPLSPLSDASGTVNLVPRAPTAPQDPSEAVTAALALFAIPVCYERYRTDALVLLCADGEASDGEDDGVHYKHAYSPCAD